MITYEDLGFPGQTFVARLLPLLPQIGNDFPSFMDDLMTQKDAMRDGGTHTAREHT